MSGTGDERLTVEPTRPPRERRPTPTVERIAPPRRPTWAEETGELRLDDREDSGIFALDTPGAEVEIEPLVAQGQARPRPPLERLLRLVSFGMLLLLLLAFFGPALVAAAHRALTGAPALDWRSVLLTVASDPPGARVFVEDRARGTTPLSSEEPCRGRPIRLRVELPGHDIWQWSGICPAKGVVLHALLQRVR